MIIYLKLISLYFSPMYSLESYQDYKYADGNNEIKINRYGIRNKIHSITIIISKDSGGHKTYRFKKRRMI